METVKITAIERKELGKKASLKDRRSGLVPCIMYSKGESQSFCADPSELKGLVYSANFKVAEISFNGKVHNCILKDLQCHPVSDVLIHVDLLKLIPGTAVKVNLPLRITGIAAGVKSGGKLVSRLRNIKVKATPEKLVDEITLDVTSLELGQTLRIRDIISTEGLEILNPAASPVVSVEVPRALKTEPIAAPAAAAATPAAATPAKAATKAPAKTPGKK